MLAACEMSGRVATAFAKRGWEAWSCDILPTEADQSDFKFRDVMTGREYHGFYRHYQGWVENLLEDHCDVICPWDLVIAFPPCTHLSLAGARYWASKRTVREGEEISRQDAAAAFFMLFADLPSVRHVAIENPRGDMTRRWRPPDQYVQPWWFGDPVRKQTGLWLKNLPLLHADDTVIPTGRVATGGGSWRTDQKHGRGANNGHEDGEGRAMRDIVRSRTLPGLARAMASQWGSYIEQEKT
jgi:hypothetical protein